MDNSIKSIVHTLLLLVDCFLETNAISSFSLPSVLALLPYRFHQASINIRRRSMWYIHRNPYKNAIPRIISEGPVSSVNFDFERHCLSGGCLVIGISCRFDFDIHLLGPFLQTIFTVTFPVVLFILKYFLKLFLPFLPLKAYMTSWSLNFFVKVITFVTTSIWFFSSVSCI